LYGASAGAATAPASLRGQRNYSAQRNRPEAEISSFEAIWWAGRKVALPDRTVSLPALQAAAIPRHPHPPELPERCMEPGRSKGCYCRVSRRRVAGSTGDQHRLARRPPVIGQAAEAS